MLTAPTSNAPRCEFCGGPVQIVSHPVGRTHLGRVYREALHCLSDCVHSRSRARHLVERTDSTVGRSS